MPDQLHEDRDLCKTLDATQICTSLKDAFKICRLSKWSSKPLQETVFLTLKLLRDVQNSFNVVFENINYVESLEEFLKKNSEINTRARLDNNINTTKFRNFKYFSDSFFKAWNFFIKFIFLVFILFKLILKNKKNLKNYISKKLKSNIYVDKWLVFYDDHIFRLNSGARLYPLKNFEKGYLTDKKKIMLSKTEKIKVLKNLERYLMYSVITVAFIAIDFLLFFALSLKKDKSIQYIPSNTFSNDMNFIPIMSQISFKIAELLEDLWRLFLTENLSSRINSRFEQPIIFEGCQLYSKSPSHFHLVFVSLFFIFSLFTTLVNPYVSRLEETLMGFYYYEAKWQRTKNIHEIIFIKRIEQEKSNVDNTIKNLNIHMNKSRKTLFAGSKSLKCTSIEKAYNWLKNKLWFDMCFVCEKSTYSIRRCPYDTCQLKICPSCLEDCLLACPFCPLCASNCNHAIVNKNSHSPNMPSNSKSKDHLVTLNVDQKAQASFSKCVSTYYGSMDKENFL